MQNLEQALQAIQESQLRRIQKSKGSEAVMTIERVLREKSLTFQDIQFKLKTELQRVCKIKQAPDEVLETSQPRLNGFGWSVPRIQSHMDHFFKEILEQYSNTIKKALAEEKNF